MPKHIQLANYGRTKTDICMLLKFNEQILNNFLIPSFSLNKGEMVIIQFPGGPYFIPLLTEMIEILTGKTANNKVEIISPLKYAEHFKESTFSRHFFPMSVGAYLSKYANMNNPIAKKIYDIEWMTPKIKVQTLAGNPRRQLSVYATLSWTSQIIFDLAGVDPQGGHEIYKFVKTIVIAGGTAILIDNNDEFKNDCTTFIQDKYLGAQL